MKELSVSGGYVTQVDDDIYERFRNTPLFSAVRPHTVYVFCKQGLLHRLIMGLKDPKVEVDHKDHNGLNNQRSNFRRANRTQNAQNGKDSGRNKTGFRGVHYDGKRRKFRASICINKKAKHLGYYSTPEEASQVYKEAVTRYFNLIY